MENVSIIERKNVKAAERQIPAVMYGKTTPSQPIFVLAAEGQARKWHKGSKFNLDYNGKTLKGTLEEVQMDPTGRKIHHLSFHVVGANDIVRTDVPVITTNEARGVQKGGVITIMINHVPLKGKLSALPEEIVIDVAKLNIGEHLTLADIKLPQGVEFAYAKTTNLSDMTVVVCNHSNAATSGASATNEAAESTAAPEVAATPNPTAN